MKLYFIAPTYVEKQLLAYFIIWNMNLDIMIGI